MPLKSYDVHCWVQQVPQSKDDCHASQALCTNISQADQAHTHGI
jgi:hypothetical protein